MTLAYDLFWSFRSPYSYLVTPRLIEFEREYDVAAKVRPVYPIVVRIDGFFKNANPMWLPYLGRDVMRIAQMLGMPFAPPRPDPIVMNMQTGQVAKEQPYIGRLTRLGVAAAERGKGLPFLREISGVIWGARRTGIRAIIWRAPPSGPGSTSPTSIVTSPRMQIATKPSSWRTKRRRSAPATGACR
jgi:hypothetical protein